QLYPFFFHYSRPHPNLHSFPTRRSSDLYVDRVDVVVAHEGNEAAVRTEGHFFFLAGRGGEARHRVGVEGVPVNVVADVQQGALRSEEHTSELQSRENLVCRLLLEKKKKI